MLSSKHTGRDMVVSLRRVEGKASGKGCVPRPCDVCT
ncbi:hypothetical protein F383_34093 [Gossypium arboreum]|uniref:Uncharacterized protein n=1 Tax=Gossypium arboreum TaxID=29729 RepID=A0A0B0N6K6_GOSAR|nr:hypothetical protein F383_34093 [Gossypium arboreum]